jgi:starvation-inducible DNA-binding protein
MRQQPFSCQARYIENERNIRNIMNKRQSRSKASADGRVRSFNTRIDLEIDVRQQMVTHLNQSLGNLFDLYSQTKQAHWNVKGEEFYQLHELFDEIAEELVKFMDMVAERATALGGEALGTVRMAASASQIDEYPAGVFDGLEVVEALAERYTRVAATVREGIDAAEEAKDMATSDLFIDVVRGLDKSLWFLEAHLQK